MAPEVLDISGLPDRELAAALHGRGLHLGVSEARRLAAALGRDPGWAELFLFDAMWSEHCSYKSSRHLLKKYLPTQAPHVILGPGEDAGAVRILTRSGTFAVVMAHESHNHPSQVMPHEGAATGVGGILRDVACMGAEVVGVLDGLRFGDPDGPASARVRAIARGVVEGIAHYGDAVGVPNLGGDVEFSEGYDDNVLVNVVAMGVCRESELVRSRVPAAAAQTPYDLILVGKPTDASGLGGASFSSVTLTGEQESAGAVQLPDPFLKRVLLLAQAEVLRRVRAAGLEVGYKDLGAGGIGCAGSEIAAAGGFGLELDLDRETLVPQDLKAEHALVAETQERFAWAVPAHFSAELVAVYRDTYQLPSLYPGAGARVIGRFAPHGRFVVTRHGERVVDVENTLITAGLSVERKSRKRRALPPVELGQVPDLTQLLRDWAASRAGGSRRPVWRFYDSEVQGRAVLRAGEADAAVFQLSPGTSEGIAVTLDGNPHWLEADPVGGAAAAVCEVVRNLAAVGAEPLALTDCLNFGSPEDPAVMGDLESVLEGLALAARAVGVRGGKALPFISGNVSLYNQRAGGRHIPPSPTVAGVGWMKDLGTATTPRLKQAGDTVWFVGQRRGNFSGSWVSRSLGCTPHGALPSPREQGAQVKAELRLVLTGLRSGAIRAAHDIAEGGALWTALEMAEPRGGMPAWGLDFESPCEPWWLEEGIGFLLEVSPGEEERLGALGARLKLECLLLARVSEHGELRFRQDGTSHVLSVAELSTARATALEDLWP